MPTTYNTSGSTGQHKIFTYSDALTERRIESRGATNGPVFPTCKSLFCDMATRITDFFEEYCKRHGVKFFKNGGGSMASTLAMFESENIEAIISVAPGLVNYALANGPHRFKCVISSGSPCSPRQSRTIRAGLGDAFWVRYGTMECGAISIADAAQVEATPGCVGVPVPGVQIEIDNGLVRVKTHTMIDGYHDPSLTTKMFKDGWFYPGDRGHMQDGLLVLEGRVK